MGESDKSRWRGRACSLAYLVFLVLFLGGYFYRGTVLIDGRERNPFARGQQPFVEASFLDDKTGSENSESESTIEVSSSLGRSLPYFTDGVVDPLFPWLMSFFRVEDPREMLEKGLWMNVIITGVFLVLFGIISARTYSLMGGVALVISGAAGGLLDESVWYLPNALHSVLMTCVWIAGLSLLRYNNLWLYGVLGVSLALLFLADSLIWPVVIALVLILTVRTVIAMTLTRKSPDLENTWTASSEIVGLAVLLTAFMIVAGPRLSYSNTRFGNAFHNYENYTAWLESPAQAGEFRTQFPNTESLSGLKTGERPGWVRFVREKGMGGLLERITKGAWGRLADFFSERFRLVLLPMLILVLWLGVIHRRAATTGEQVWRVGGTSAQWMAAFALTVFLVTLVFEGIAYRPHPEDARLGSLFLPLIVTLIWTGNRFRRQLQRTDRAVSANRIFLSVAVIPLVGFIALLIF